MKPTKFWLSNWGYILMFPFSGNSENRIGMIFMLLFYHLFLTLFMWSYWRTIMTSVGRIPDQVSESYTLSARVKV